MVKGPGPKLSGRGSSQAQLEEGRAYKPQSKVAKDEMEPARRNGGRVLKGGCVALEKKRNGSDPVTG